MVAIQRGSVSYERGNPVMGQVGFAATNQGNLDRTGLVCVYEQGFLAQKKTPTPLGPP